MAEEAHSSESRPRQGPRAVEADGAVPAELVVPASVTMPQKVRLDKAGRLVVPVAIRKALGIREEAVLIIEVENGCIKLQTIRSALEQVRAIAARYPSTREGEGSAVDELIAERRTEAAKECAEEEHR